MKVKFNRKRLVAALKKSREDALELFKKDTREWHTNVLKAQGRLIENVEQYLREVKKAKPETINTYRLSDAITKGCDFPSKPKPPRLDHVDALIQQLELSDDEVIVCDTKEEYVQLTRACAVLGTCKA